MTAEKIRERWEALRPRVRGSASLRGDVLTEAISVSRAADEWARQNDSSDLDDVREAMRANNIPTNWRAASKAHHMDLHMGALSTDEIAAHVDQGLASLIARAEDSDDEELYPLLHELQLVCDRWDDFANALPGFREPANNPASP